LPQIVLAGCAASLLSRRLKRWQENRHQDADDRDHDHQLDERKTV
jgi:hypothetical protein